MAKQLLHLVFGGELKAPGRRRVRGSREARHRRHLSRITGRRTRPGGRGAEDRRRCPRRATSSSTCTACSTPRATTRSAEVCASARRRANLEARPTRGRSMKVALIQMNSQGRQGAQSRAGARSDRAGGRRGAAGPRGAARDLAAAQRRRCREARRRRAGAGRRGLWPAPGARRAPPHRPARRLDHRAGRRRASTTPPWCSTATAGSSPATASCTCSTS